MPGGEVPGTPAAGGQVGTTLQTEGLVRVQSGNLLTTLIRDSTRPLEWEQRECREALSCHPTLNENFHWLKPRPFFFFFPVRKITLVIYLKFIKWVHNNFLLQKLNRTKFGSFFPLLDWDICLHQVSSRPYYLSARCSLHSSPSWTHKKAPEHTLKLLQLQAGGRPKRPSTGQQARKNTGRLRQQNGWGLEKEKRLTGQILETKEGGWNGELLKRR